MDIALEKKRIRQRIRAERDALDLADYRRLSNAVASLLTGMPEWRRAQRVHIYVSAINNEVDTLGLMYRLFDDGKTVVVPLCSHDTHTLCNIRINSLDQLTPCRFGLMEPVYDAAREMPPESLDLVVAPLLAFDRQGRRLGFGGGFYDSLISAVRCPVVGLAYSFQEVTEVPVEAHDLPLSAIVTDKEIIRV